MSTQTMVRRSPLVTFFVLAFALTWILLPLLRISVLFGLVALFGPAAAAFITAYLVDGRAGIADLASRLVRWRVSWRWYAVALLLPIAVSALAAALERLIGGAGSIKSMPMSPLGMVVFVLVVGEEIGWRGFALPRLLQRWGGWEASIILGGLWGLWHLPLFYLPGMPQFGTPLQWFIPYTMALSVLLTILHQRTGGSVLLATLFHGAVNTFGFLNPEAGQGLRAVGNAIAYGAVAILAGAVALRRIPRPSAVAAAGS